MPPGSSVTAILTSIAFVLMFAKPIGEFVERHPTIKVLALSFLIMIEEGRPTLSVRRRRIRLRPGLRRYVRFRDPAPICHT